MIACYDDNTSARDYAVPVAHILGWDTEPVNQEPPRVQNIADNCRHLHNKDYEDYGDTIGLWGHNT